MMELNTRTIITGVMVLGAPLYIKGEYFGIIKRLMKSDQLQVLETEFDDKFKYIFIKDNTVYVPHIVLEQDLSSAEDWCDYSTGLIGAGDIDDGDSVYYRTHGDTKYREMVDFLELEVFHSDTYDDKRNLGLHSQTIEIRLDFYQNEALEYLIPTAFYSFRKITAVTIYYCRAYSTNNLI